MKNLILASALLLSSIAAHADYNTDALEATVTCKVGNIGSVSINAKRNLINVKLKAPKSANGQYPVSKRNSDGDTFVSYQAGVVVLSFDDRGDQLEIDGAVHDIKCP